jgi:hypothetical protein
MRILTKPTGPRLHPAQSRELFNGCVLSFPASVAGLQLIGKNNSSTAIFFTINP